MEYRIHGLTDELTSNAKRQLSLMPDSDELPLVRNNAFGRDELLLVRSIGENTELKFESHQKPEADERELIPTEHRARPSLSKGRKGLTLTLKAIGKILYL